MTVVLPKTLWKTSSSSSSSRHVLRLPLSLPVKPVTEKWDVRPPENWRKMVGLPSSLFRVAWHPTHRRSTKVVPMTHTKKWLRWRAQQPTHINKRDQQRHQQQYAAAAAGGPAIAWIGGEGGALWCALFGPTVTAATTSTVTVAAAAAGYCSFAGVA